MNAGLAVFDWTEVGSPGRDGEREGERERRESVFFRVNEAFPAAFSGSLNLMKLLRPFSGLARHGQGNTAASFSLRSPSSLFILADRVCQVQRCSADQLSWNYVLLTSMWGVWVVRLGNSLATLAGGTFHKCVNER